MQYQILVDDEKGPGITQGEILERSESVHYSLDHDYARIKAHQLKPYSAHQKSRGLFGNAKQELDKWIILV